MKSTGLHFSDYEREQGNKRAIKIHSKLPEAKSRNHQGSRKFKGDCDISQIFIYFIFL